MWSCDGGLMGGIWLDGCGSEDGGSGVDLCACVHACGGVGTGRGSQTCLGDDTLGVAVSPTVQLGVEVGAVSVAVDDRGEYGAVCSMASVLSVWSQSDYSAVARIARPPAEAWGIAFAPRAASGGDATLRLALAGGNNNAVHVLEVEARSDGGAVRSEPSGSTTLALPTEEDKQRAERFALSVAFSPDGKYIAAGGMDGTVALFDAAAGKLVASLPGHYKPVRGLTFTPGTVAGGKGRLGFGRSSGMVVAM